MIVHQYVKDFENMGLGMFVHFGIYSTLAQGEWVMHQHKIPREEYRSHARFARQAPDIQIFEKGRKK